MPQRLLAAAALAVMPLAAYAAPAPPWQGKLHACTLPEGHVEAFVLRELQGVREPRGPRRAEDRSEDRPSAGEGHGRPARPPLAASALLQPSVIMAA
jgi:hypothetical protein